jgi:hypothetical protein
VCKASWHGLPSIPCAEALRVCTDNSDSTAGLNILMSFVLDTFNAEIEEATQQQLDAAPDAHISPSTARRRITVVEGSLLSPLPHVAGAHCTCIRIAVQRHVLCFMRRALPRPTITCM